MCVVYGPVCSLPLARGELLTCPLSEDVTRSHSDIWMKQCNAVQQSVHACKALAWLAAFGLFFSCFSFLWGGHLGRSRSIAVR